MDICIYWDSVRWNNKKMQMQENQKTGQNVTGWCAMDYLDMEEGSEDGRRL